MKVHRRDATNSVRQASQFTPHLHNTGAHVGCLDRRLTADTAWHELHAATRPHAVALHPLQLRLHHLLLDDVIRR